MFLPEDTLIKLEANDALHGYAESYIFPSVFFSPKQNIQSPIPNECILKL